MGEMILKTSHEDFYVFVQREEKFKDMVEEIPERYQDAEMYSVSIIQKKPDWIHNRAIMDFKYGEEYMHGQYLMGWFMDKDNVDGLVKIADEYVADFVAIPKPDRDVAEYFSDENSDKVLNHFFEVAGIEVND